MAPLPARRILLVDADAFFVAVARMADPEGAGRAELLIVGGEGHKPGTGGDTEERYARLEAFAREHWDVRSVEYRWSAQDNTTDDGLPFVGRAGQLLEQLLVEIGLSRKDVFITNTLKCRPPNNRDPLPGELEVCTPYLFRQIALIEPKVICTLGNFATKLLTGRPTGITRAHGIPVVRELGGRWVRVFPTFHPAAALRTPQLVQTRSP